MRTTMRLLGIFPYPYMKPLMLEVLLDFPQIEMDAYVGYMEQGVALAQEVGVEKYDAIISRGDTADLLESLGLPVVPIQVSLYDILCALQLAQAGTQRLAIVGSPTVIASTQKLCAVLGYTNLDFYTADSAISMAQHLRTIKAASYDAMLCDASVNIMARGLGLNPILIGSGEESLRKTLQQALLLHKSKQVLQSKSDLLHQVLQAHPDQVAVLDDQENLVYTSLPPKLAHLAQSSPGKSVRTVGGVQYVLRTKRIVAGDEWYTASYVERRKLPSAQSRDGIVIRNHQGVLQALDESVFSFSGRTEEILPKLKKLLGNGAPVVLCGEVSTGAPALIYALYLESVPSLSSLVSIDCSALSEKSWSFLIHHPSSPLMDSGCLLHFSHLDALASHQRQTLCTALFEGQVCRRNQVVFACLCPWDSPTSPEGTELANALYCQMFYLPPLRQLQAQLPGMIQMTLSHLNMRHDRTVVRLEDDALAQMQDFPWPHNYRQLRRVMETLVLGASSAVLTAKEVEAVLDAERTACKTPLINGFGVDLSKTLDELNRDIALQVLQETGGNQTAAAKRLGISRTTFWRLVRNS